MIVFKVHYETTKRAPRFQDTVLFNQFVLQYSEYRSLGYFKREFKNKSRWSNLTPRSDFI